MTKKIYCLMLLVLVLVFAGCKKDSSEVAGGDAASGNEAAVSDSSSILNSIQFCKVDGALAYTDKGNVGKTWDDMKKLDKSEYYWFYFGDKVTALDSIKNGDKVFFKVRMPDDSTYWINKENLTERMIVINQDNVACFTQPDSSYKAGVNLQKGDLGYVVSEKNEYLEVDFYAYRPVKNGANRVFVGKKWINNGGYTESITAAKEAFYLNNATYWDVIKNDKEKAAKILEKALEISSNIEETEITSVVKNYMGSLNGNPVEAGSPAAE